MTSLMNYPLDGKQSPFYKLIDFLLSIYAIDEKQYLSCEHDSIPDVIVHIPLLIFV